MTDGPDRSPARLSAALALGAGVAVVAAVGAVNPIGLVPAAVGIPLLLVGLVRGSRRALSIGAFALFAGVLVAGVAGAPVEPILVGTAATVLAWDVGEQAIGVGEQLGRAARTRRGEAVHAASSTVVGVGAVAVGYAVFRSATGGQPLVALVLLLVAAVAIAAWLRD